MRRIIVAPVFDYSGPAWHGGSPEEQGYRIMALPKLKRHDAKNNEYYVYTSDTEYTAVLAESAVLAVEESKVTDPKKVVHAHSRIADVMDSKKLEFIGIDASVEDSAPEIVDGVTAPQEVAPEPTPEVASAPEAEKTE